MNRLGDQKSTPKIVTTPRQQTTTNPLRLLIDKSVFLDLNTSYKQLGKLKECLTTIGVNIADCMSKDVNYVITNRVKYEDLKLLTIDVNKINSTPKKTSPTVAFSRVGAINRTQAILEKASKGNVCTDILTSARRLGISIMHVIEIEKYVEKYTNKTNLLTNNPNKVNTMTKLNKEKSSHQLNDKDLMIENHHHNNNNNNLRKLKSPFLKFESVCKQYKPIYFEFKQWQDIVIDSTVKSNHSPFQIFFTDDIKDNLSSTSSTDEVKTTNDVKTGSFQSTAFDTNMLMTSSQQQTITIKTPRTISTISNTSSVHQALNRLATTTVATPRVAPVVATNKRKLGGYCECCKLRYDNLKQHLTSLQHENFEKNQTNFKELDAYINDTLNFQGFFEDLREKRIAVKKEENLNEITLTEDDSSINMDDKQNSKLKIDRLINESKSLGEKKSEKRRSNTVTKYTDITNKDFNAIISTKTKSTKRKRKPTSAATNEEKPRIKIKLERNKSNNSWQISSSSACNVDDEIEKKFDNALLELVKECEEENNPQTPTIENIKSKRPKIDNNELPSFQEAFMQQQPSLFSAKQLNSLNEQIIVANQIRNFCIYMAPPPPLPPLLPPMYHPAPFYMPPQPTSFINKYRNQHQ